MNYRQNRSRICPFSVSGTSVANPPGWERQLPGTLNGQALLGAGRFVVLGQTMV